MIRRTWFRSTRTSRTHAGRTRSRARSRFDLEQLEQRTVMAAENVIFPTGYESLQADLRPMDVIKSQNGVLEANVKMVSAGFDSNPILYGGQEVYSSLPDEDHDYNSYAMAYQFDAYGTSYPAGFPGTMLQINRGDLLKVHLTNDLAGDNYPSDPVFTRNRVS